EVAEGHRGEAFHTRPANRADEHAETVELQRVGRGRDAAELDERQVLGGDVQATDAQSAELIMLDPPVGLTKAEATVERVAGAAARVDLVDGATGGTDRLPLHVETRRPHGSDLGAAAQTHTGRRLRVVDRVDARLGTIVPVEEGAVDLTREGHGHLAVALAD